MFFEPLLFFSCEVTPLQNLDPSLQRPLLADDMMPPVSEKVPVFTKKSRDTKEEILNVQTHRTTSGFSNGHDAAESSSTSPKFNRL